MGASKEYGVEAIELHERRLDINMFFDFLKECKQHHNSNFVLIGDNCSIHKSAVTKKFLGQWANDGVKYHPPTRTYRKCENVFSQ